MKAIFWMGWLGNLALIKSIKELDDAIIKCHKCPRLVQWREDVAITKRKSYADHDYWGKAVPGFGGANAKILIVGLAPGAHGANRTGRIFTGDSSGDWLFGSLHRVGLASIPTSTARNDGQRLLGARISCVVRCAPPDNKPSNEERNNCLPFLHRELELLKDVRAYVCLGKFAFDGLVKELKILGHQIPTTKFGHGVEIKYSHNGRKYLIICSYHPSQQNTFTGKLTTKMLDSVLKKAGRFASLPS